MNRILVYRAGMIGDAIVAVPAIQALRRAYPQASFALMSVGGVPGRLDACGVLREFGWFDELITYEPGVVRSVRALAALCARVRQFGADMVVYLGSERNSLARILRDRLFFLLAGTTRFVAHVSDSVSWYGALKTGDAIRPYEVDRLLQIARGAGAAAPGRVRFDLPLGDAVRTRIDRLLSQHGLDAATRLVAICPGSAQPAKRWPVDRFDAIARRLLDEPGTAIIVIGGEHEAAIGRELGAGWPRRRWWNAASTLSVLETAELARRCALYVGNDTGAMHVAAAVGTRCVAVFSAHGPAQQWHPYGDGHLVLRSAPECRNCFLSECTYHQSKCLTAISVEQVWDACQQALGRR
jgi:ADP-heptose:LPS heptosyltransferase